MKAHVEQYARQREEEQAILRAARQAREEQKKVKLTTEEVAKIQERACRISSLSIGYTVVRPFRDTVHHQVKCSR